MLVAEFASLLAENSVYPWEDLKRVDAVDVKTMQSLQLEHRRRIHHLIENAQTPGYSGTKRTGETMKSYIIFHRSTTLAIVKCQKLGPRFGLKFLQS